MWIFEHLCETQNAVFNLFSKAIVSKAICRTATGNYFFFLPLLQNKNLRCRFLLIFKVEYYCLEIEKKIVGNGNPEFAVGRHAEHNIPSSLSYAESLAR